MISALFIGALVSICGFIVIPELTIPESAPLMTLLKFTTISAFMIHITAMVGIGVLLFTDTIERLKKEIE